jgi:hypothetical protein
MHSKSHLRGCPHKGISKDAHRKGARRMCNKKPREMQSREYIHIEKQQEVNIRTKEKKDYNESRPDQHKYSATLHPGRTRLKASQLIDTLALFASCSMGIFTKQILKPPKQTPTS